MESCRYYSNLTNSSIAADTRPILVGRCVYQPLESVMKQERNPGSSYDVTSVLLRACHYLWTSYLRISNRSGYKFTDTTPYCFTPKMIVSKILTLSFRDITLICQWIYWRYNHIWDDRTFSDSFKTISGVDTTLRSISKSLRHQNLFQTPNWIANSWPKFWNFSNY